MSGVNRNIKADIQEQGLTGEQAMAELSPEKIRAEKGTCEEEANEETTEETTEK